MLDSTAASGCSSVDADDGEQLLVDTHCHVHLPRTNSDDSGDDEDPGELPPSVRTCIFSTDESNWQATLDAAEQQSHVAAAGIGVHPWFVRELVGGWQERLRAKLLENPHAVVGEIGLDKAYKRDGQAVDYELQQAVFAEQLGIAASLQRPVSVHCVRAYGHLVEALQRAPELPPAIALQHPSTRGRVYFGFSRSVNMRDGRAADKLAETVQSIPMENILLESDSHDRTMVVPDLRQVIAAISAVKQLSQQEVLRIANANARRIFGAIVKRQF